MHHLDVSKEVPRWSGHFIGGVLIRTSPDFSEANPLVTGKVPVHQLVRLQRLSTSDHRQKPQTDPHRYCLIYLVKSLICTAKTFDHFSIIAISAGGYHMESISKPVKVDIHCQCLTNPAIIILIIIMYFSNSVHTWHYGMTTIKPNKCQITSNETTNQNWEHRVHQAKNN